MDFSIKVAIAIAIAIRHNAMKVIVLMTKLTYFSVLIQSGDICLSISPICTACACTESITSVTDIAVVKTIVTIVTTVTAVTTLKIVRTSQQREISHRKI